MFTDLDESIQSYYYWYPESKRLPPLTHHKTKRRRYSKQNSIRKCKYNWCTIWSILTNQVWPFSVGDVHGFSTTQQRLLFVESSCPWRCWGSEYDDGDILVWAQYSYVSFKQPGNNKHRRSNGCWEILNPIQQCEIEAQIDTHAIESHWSIKRWY